ncbi:MAG: ABC transporter permease [Ectothiorhodospiraceae bacterium]|nr:ABC transporter permease [Ectothiorhodospiraceae bacterium]
MTRTIHLVLKELMVLLKDPKSRMVIFVPPLVQLLVFGYAATFDLDRIPYALLLQDDGAPARELAAALAGSPHFHEVARIGSEREIAPLVDSRAVLMVVRTGATFTRDILRGGTGAIQVVIDGRNSNTALVALGYVRAIVSELNQRWSRALGRPSARAHLQPRAWYNPNLQSRWFIVPGIVGLLTLVVTLLVTALSVAREREQGTFDQLLVTPLTPLELLAGKALPGFVIGLAEASAIVAVAALWFEVPLRGSLVALYAGLVLFLMSAVGVGLMISSLAVTQQQGMFGAFLFLVPAVILSGFATPIANMPALLQTITLVNPLRHFEVVLRRVFLEGVGVDAVVPQLVPMAAIGVTAMAIAAWMFRRRAV